MSGLPPETPAELGTADAQTVLGGTAWTAVSAFIPPLQTLIVSVVAARFLGTVGFGQQSLIAFVSLSCSYVLAARMPAALGRFGAQMVGSGQLGMLRTLYERTYRVQLAVGALMLVGFGALAAAGAVPQAAWVLAGIATFVSVVQAAPAGLLTASQRWRDNVVPGTVTVLIASVFMVIVLAAGGGVAGYFAVEVAMVAANLVWTWRLARRVSRLLPEPEPIEISLRAEFRTFIRASTFLVLIEFVILNRSEILFLNHYSTAAQVGFYSIAFAASEAVARFPAILTSVSLPAVANLHGAGEHDKIRNGFWRALRFLAATCPALVVIAAALGTDLIGIVYGAEFVPAEPVVVILLVPYAVLPMMGMSDALLWTFGRIRFLVISGLLATVVDIGAAFVLVPRYDAIGAAVASDLGALTIGLPGLWLAWRLMAPAVFDRRVLANNLAIALACAAATILPVVFLGGVVGLIVGGVAVAAVVWLLGGFLGILSAADTAWLDEAVGGRAGGRLGTVIRHFGFAGGQTST